MPIFGCASDEQLERELNINTVSQWQHNNPRSDSDKRFINLLNETFDVERKCDFCNCAMRDCSLCCVGSFDDFDDDTPIC